jgi:hypothetical protein
MSPIMSHPLGLICHNCGNQYGQHRVRDDACPRNQWNGHQGGYHGNMKFKPTTEPTSE